MRELVVFGIEAWWTSASEMMGALVAEGGPWRRSARARSPSGYDAVSAHGA